MKQIYIENMPNLPFNVSEALNQLRVSLGFSGEDIKTIMVTSSTPNEGKSFVAMQLWKMMAEVGNRVLLIDCDLRKPACHKVLTQKFNSGIKEVLQNKAALGDSVLRYKKTNMYMLLGTKGDKNIGDLISSERMDALLKVARKNFDFIVMDLPPLSAASDAEGVAGLADACLLVIRQNLAVAPSLNIAIGALESQNAKMLGCVLNNVYSSRLTESGSCGGYNKYDRHSGFDYDMASK